jgi:N-acyl homoserine lactone hydrolase
MRVRTMLALAGAVAGAGFIVNSFLPQRLATEQEQIVPHETVSNTDFPAIDVRFLRSGTTIIPKWLAVRGSISFAPHTVAHAAVLIRHPKGQFLFDTAFCEDIGLFLMDQSLFFKKTLANFTLEHPIRELLAGVHLTPRDLDFVLLSHLHWDHVAGIPDLPDVRLRIHRVEYDMACQGLFEQRQGLVRRLLSNNPVDLFDLTGPSYRGFRSSYDLFGDGSLVLVPLSGHTSGQIGLFINRSNGSPLFLISDAVFCAENYLRPTPMHPVLWSMVTHDNATALQTLIDLHRFSKQYPEVPMIGMHDAHMQEVFASIEQTGYTVAM